MKDTLLSLFFLFSFGNVVSQINNDYLQIGETAPKIVGVNQFNVSIDSDELLKENKILLIFYRGNWCPYCKKHLASLQENLEKLQKKGVYVIVVTPERVDKIEETTRKWDATFSILHDSNNEIMNDYKVAFEVNQENVPNYLSFTQKRIQEYNEIENNVLPVPATYLIDMNNKISYVQYDPNYKNRANFDDILAILK